MEKKIKDLWITCLAKQGSRKKNKGWVQRTFVLNKLLAETATLSLERIIPDE